MATIQTFTTTGTWTCPADVFSVQVECWGAGGGCPGGITNDAGGGGGGGAYSSLTSFVPVIGNTYTVTVGAGASGLLGGDSWFNTNTTVLAKGGSAGTVTSGGGVGGQGGQSASGIGNTLNSGGNGANGVAANHGGGGGGAADTGGNGGNGSGATGGSAASGGVAGAGGTATSNGNNYGGGGSGNVNSGGATSGAGGYVRLTYTVEPTTRYWVGGTGTWDSTTTTNWSYTSGGSGGAYAPIATDSVYFDSNSGGGVVTLSSPNAVSSVSISGFTGSFPNFVVTATTVSLNSSAISLTGTGTVWNVTGTVNAGTSTIIVSDTSSSSKTFAGGGLTYNNLTFTGGTGVHIITGSNTFNALTITTPPSTINFTAGTTQTVSSFPVSGTAGNLNTLQSTVSGSTWYLASASQISIDYVSLQDSHAVYL